MVWGGWDNFWAMGGYAPFVWGSYGVTVATFALEIWLVRARRRRALAEAARMRKQGRERGMEPAQ
jgi:heme exporter protein D